MLPTTIVDALARGATVLTGNQRAARTLQQQFDRRNRQLGLETWEPPRVLAWGAWMADLWTRLLLEGHATKLLLNPAQEHTLWRAIIADNSGGANSLLTTDALATMAADAWSRLCAYQGERRLQTAGVSVDTRTFQRWAFAFEERCRVDGYLPQAQLATTLAIAVRSHQHVLDPGGYVLVGFDSWTPAQQALLRAANISAEELSMDLVQQERLLIAAETPREELLCAARWMRQRLEAHPGETIALIVPGLEGRRAEIDRVLRNTLAPELEEITLQGALPPFEFSLGVPLARTPLGTAALDLLRWAVDALPMDRVSRLMLSPYLADGVELDVRAEFDAYELRRTSLLRPEVTLDAMVRLVEGAKRSHRLTRLLAALKSMRRVADEEGFTAAGLRSHADWSEAMHALLAASGWNGTGGSIEFQTRRKWESLLDELATLDFTGVRVSPRDAWQTVKRLTEETLFAPESRGAPVQVMGPLESAGSAFDAIWFLGAGELEWPQRPGSSPLLSWHLQRELGMPGADAERDAQYARGMTERIARSAQTVIFSYATERADAHQRMSAMLSGLDLQVLSAQALLKPAIILPPVMLETIDDSQTLPALPDQVLRGGARLLQLQAACGFRAFAEQRLWATTLAAAEAGMDARERGTAVHAALEIFWKQVQSQAALKALTREERQGILTGAVAVALGKTARNAHSAWDAAYVDIQHERLLSLLDAWLVTEMDRAVPFTVKSSETELKDVSIGPLRLSLRVDRVDETEFGDVIVDYKTGAASPTDWQSERPDEPQLPLYAVLADSDQLAGIAFAQVRAGKDMTLYGYETQQGVLLKGAKLNGATLDEQVEAWRASLTALAEDFHRGDVRVRPKKYPNTCEFCEQRLLCRLDISLLNPEVTEDEDGDLEDARG